MSINLISTYESSPRHAAEIQALKNEVNELLARVSEQNKRLNTLANAFRSDEDTIAHSNDSLTKLLQENKYLDKKIHKLEQDQSNLRTSAAILAVGVVASGGLAGAAVGLLATTSEVALPTLLIAGGGASAISTGVLYSKSKGSYL